MPIYACRTLTSAGSVRENRIEAMSESHVRSLIRSRGERVLQVTEMAIKQAAPRAAQSGKRPSLDEVSAMMRQMSILVRAGVPLVEGLRGLAEQTRSQSLQACLEDITLEVSHGMALSDAFARHPGVFPNLAVEMAKVAEAGGSLAESMERLAEHMETGAEIVRKIKSALAYPLVVLVISVVTVLVMVTFILPRFMKLFGQMGAKLPWTTKMLMSVSHALTSEWYLFVAGTAAVVYLFKRYAASPSGRCRLDGLVLKLPLLGDIVNKVVLSRVMASMATLLSSGVPMVKTLEISAAAANNEVVKEALMKARTDVAEGNATSQSLRVSGLFPPLVLQMVTSGEKTGELPSMLNYVCALYGRETDAKIKSLTSVIEPIMIVVLGLIVGFIAMSVIVPIYSLVGGVK